MTVPSPSQTSQRAAGDVEGEVASGVALAAGVGLGGEEGSDVVEGLDICNWIGSRGFDRWGD